MTLTFRCNGCRLVMEFHDQRGVLFYGDDRELRRDLCRECYQAVDDFIDDLYKANALKRENQK
jgi:hypothetical protein